LFSKYKEPSNFAERLKLYHQKKNKITLKI
jgi:sulfatase maturation enzyme AslB (radical SAM superfamily)